MQIIVLGMHRSGTSSITNLLHDMGAYFGPEGISTGASWENPKGFWERRDVRQVCDRLLQGSGFDWWKVKDFSPESIPAELLREGMQKFASIVDEMNAHRPWVMKEPRLCLLLPVLLEVLDDPFTVVTLRHPWEVARSLKTRNGMPEDVGLALWEKYMRAAVKHSSRLPRCLVDYNDLVQAPDLAIEKFMSGLAEAYTGRIPLSAEAARGVIDQSLRRESHDDMPDTARASGAMRLYEALKNVGLDGALSRVKATRSVALGIFEGMGGLPSLQRQQEKERVEGALIRIGTKLQSLTEDLSASRRDISKLTSEAAETRKQFTVEARRLERERDRAHKDAADARQQFEADKQRLENERNQAQRETVDARQQFEADKQRLENERNKARTETAARSTAYLRRTEQRDELRLERRKLRATQDRLQAKLEQEAKRIQTLNARLKTMRSSTTWRLGAPLRFIGRRFSTLAPLGRQAAKLTWWTVSLQLGRRVRARLRLQQEARLIRASNLFDAEWYLTRNPRLRRSGGDPALHYLTTGARNGRDPSPHFTTTWYAEQAPEVGRTGMNPLVHYLTHDDADRPSPKPPKPVQITTQKRSIQMLPAAKLPPAVEPPPAKFVPAPKPDEAPADWGPRSGVAEEVERYSSAPRQGRRIVVYTAVAGGYDHLMVPDRLDPEIDYVCFSDAPINNYGVWQIRPMPFHHPDPTRKARYVKLHPHMLFPQHEVAVWVDSNVLIRGDVRPYVEAVLASAPSIGLTPHPLRDCVYDEAEECKKRGKDDPAAIDRQVARYRDLGIEASAGMYETNFFVTSLTAPEPKRLFPAWWKEVATQTRRDQLAITYALRETGLAPLHLFPKGTCVRNHDDFQIFRHEKTRRFAVPTALQAYVNLVDPFAGRTTPAAAKPTATPTTDIIVCVYNALADVRLCLDAARRHLLERQRIIIVNDKSNEDTTLFLRSFAEGDTDVHLLENEVNLGYTLTANRGLAQSDADFRILLNSDTIVPPGWVHKMVATAYACDTIGIVGPLSNAASWQSIPETRGTAGQTVINPLPEGMSVEDMDQACENWSLAGELTIVPLIHGFCFGVRREVIETIGLFDAVNFERYYGEENDYCFRAVKAGFDLAVATDTFVFHKKSMSIAAEERAIWMSKASQTFRALHGKESVALALKQMDEHPLLARMRAKAHAYYDVSAAAKDGPAPLRWSGG